MKTFLNICVFGILLSFAATADAQTSKYKCMLQMNAYTGEEAYVVVSLINPKGAYEKTLYMMGDDKQWYNSFKEWFKFFSKTKKVNAKTGASVGGGDRSMVNLEIDDAKLNKGYKLRFESAVEDQKYYVADIEIPLTTEALAGKADGKGYIKYIRFSKVQP
ncbi:DUF2271 domain-containing protein [Pedobacter alpinus]|uniref:DUF2271 domain-containing protein n=1 Tax=Pedobacter alpinus TaxID=1590643 RepID=A0ABW5TRI5_9SPHI